MFKILNSNKGNVKLLLLRKDIYVETIHVNVVNSIGHKMPLLAHKLEFCLLKFNKLYTKQVQTVKCDIH